MFQVIAEKPVDGPEIEKLLDQSFGPNRLERAAYCLRGDKPPIPELCFVLRGAIFLCATIRYWPVVIEGSHPALLLGPLAVGQAWRGRGLGKILINHSLARARAMGHGAVLVIGDPAYYQPFGFTTELVENLTLSKSVDSCRFQGLELQPGALHGRSGLVENQCHYRREGG